MGLVGALHSLRSFRRRLPWALGHVQQPLQQIEKTSGRNRASLSTPLARLHSVYSDICDCLHSNPARLMRFIERSLLCILYSSAPNGLSMRWRTIRISLEIFI